LNARSITDIEEGQPDSPWMIEAVDGESSEKEEVLFLAYSSYIKDKTEHGRTVITSVPSDSLASEEPSTWTTPSSDEQQSHSAVPDTTLKKSNTTTSLQSSSQASNRWDV
jgi:hypothetical protein